MFSSLISKSSSSTTVGFSIFIVGSLTQASFPCYLNCSYMSIVLIGLHLLLQVVTASGFPYSETFSNTYRIIWSLFPPNLLAEALKLLADATSSPGDIGISWSRRAECAPNDTECVITIVCKYFEAQNPKFVIVHSTSAKRSSLLLLLPC